VKNPLREKSVIAAVLVSMLALSVSLISIATGAEPDVNVYLSTDKPYYTYGGSGKLYVTVRNEGPGPIAIRNISVTFPWFGWYNGGWDGNTTITDIEENTVDENATSQTFEVPFTVPAEGRPFSYHPHMIKVEYEWGDESAHAYAYIDIPVETPVTQSPNLTPILYLMAADTIILLLVIVALFYVWGSLRRPTPVSPAAFATG